MDEAIQKFLRRVDRSEDPAGCWLWQGYRNHKGYGRLSFKGRHVRAHRLAAHFFLGFDLNSELFVCHRCDTPSCVNPDHLFVGTVSDNARDMRSKGRGGNASANLPANGTGELNRQAKLSNDQARYARAAVAQGATRTEIARQLGVARQTIASLVAGRTWKAVV